MNRRWMKPILALCLGVLVGLLVAECLLRVLRIRPERYEAPRWQVQVDGEFLDSDIWGGGRVKRRSRFEGLGVKMGEYVPGAVFRCVYASNPSGYFDADNGAVMTVGLDGLRGGAAPIAKRKSPGTYRILLLGDSFTFGVGVRDEDTFARVLERRLNAQGHGSPRVEVMNAAVQGYNTRDEVLYLEHQWLAFQPDLVLIVFYINDAYADDAILNMGQELGFDLERPVGLARHSYLWDLASHKILARQVSRRVQAFYRSFYFAEARQFLGNPGGERVDWRVSRAALARAAALTRANGTRLGLVVFPELYGLDGAYPFTDVHRLVKETCGELAVPCLDLFDAFRGRDERALWVHPTDHHPNEKAHRLVADAVQAWLGEVGGR